MRKLSFIALLLAFGLMACNTKTENPLLTKYDTPYNVPPFEKVKPEHYKEAFEAGIKEQLAEIYAIVKNTEEPTFENTIVPYANSGVLLGEVNMLFSSLSSANTNAKLQALDKEISPMLSAHYDEILLNEKLFGRIESVFQQKDKLQLTPEQSFILENTYKSFVRNGSNLKGAKREKLKEINQRLSVLVVEFTQNLLAETNDFKLVVDKKEDLAGLSEGSIKTAAETAEAEGLKGKWVFTPHKPSMIPFLQSSEKRELREKLYNAYINRGNNNNAKDNKKILAEMVKLRVERAHLLGYKSHANIVLESRMAKTPETAMSFLNDLWTPALNRAKQEAKELQAIIDQEGGNFKLAPSDWWYYAEKLRKAKYNLNDSELRPYFSLDNVRNGMFMVANKLFGLKFEEIKDIPKPHTDAVAFKVLDKDGSYLGVLYNDYYPRASKVGGAWCGVYRMQTTRNGERVAPIVTMVMNFTPPTSDTPSMLSLDEVETLFHEFGHALDDLLSECTYDARFIATDFVELPSQIMEHWAFEPAVLKEYAKHYKTGEIIPDNLIEKIEKSGLFNQGFATTEFLAAALLDMKYHSMSEPKDIDIEQFEKEYFDEIGLIPEIISRYRSTYFAHIAGWGYSAGYYSYIWSGILDNDAFQAFKETSIYDQDYAQKFRDNVLAKIGIEDPMALYIKFRGKEPSREALLKARGLK